MNTKFKIGNIVKNTGSDNLRVYKITGQSDTGHYMKNVITGIQLGYAPSDEYIISATVEDVLKAHCYDNIALEIRLIDDCVEAYKAQVEFSIHWNDRIDDYPPQLLEMQSFDFGSFVSKWVSHNSAVPSFQPEN